MVDAQYYKTFGQNLRILRTSRELTMQMLAVECDCSMYTIQSYELGRKGPNFKRFLQICNTLKVSPNILLQGLYSSKNELIDIAAVEEVYKNLNHGQSVLLHKFFDVIVNCMVETEPKLKNADFGTRVHLLRVNAQLDAESLARQCLIAKPTLLGYESNQNDPSIPVLLRICDILHVSPEYLLLPKLNFLSDESQYGYLRPQQIKALCEAAVHFKSFFNE